MVISGWIGEGYHVTALLTEDLCCFLRREPHSGFGC